MLLESVLQAVSVTILDKLVVAMIVVETFAMSYYMPVLLVAGLITGFLIGAVADQVLRRISDIMFLE